jgi:hypothetical protein
MSDLTTVNLSPYSFAAQWYLIFISALFRLFDQVCIRYRHLVTMYGSFKPTAQKYEVTYHLVTYRPLVLFTEHCCCKTGSLETTRGRYN